VLWRDNDPGAITDWSWTEAQLSYIHKVAPSALSKVIWEFPLYGNKWEQQYDGKWKRIDADVSCPDAVALSQSTAITLREEGIDPSPHLVYPYKGKERQLWYNTSQSLIILMRSLQQEERTLLHTPSFKLPVSFWYRGNECTDCNVTLHQFYS
jgi:spore germination protein YaaH